MFSSPTYVKSIQSRFTSRKLALLPAVGTPWFVLVICLSIDFLFPGNVFGTLIERYKKKSLHRRRRRE